jgi:hypothetical protein
VTPIVTAGRGVQGNTISGSFRISFLGGVTRPIPVNASAALVKSILEVCAARHLRASIKEREFLEPTPACVCACVQEDLRNVSVVNAEVVRSNPTDECEAGLCPNGPQAAWGLTWSLTLVSSDNIIIPRSPTDRTPLFNGTIAPVLPFLVDVNVTSSVSGTFAVSHATRLPAETVDDASRSCRVPREPLCRMRRCTTASRTSSRSRFWCTTSRRP